MRYVLAMWLAVGIALGPPAHAEIPRSAEQDPVEWRYALTKPADSWTQATYDDSSWTTGVAGFGTSVVPGTSTRTEWKSPDIWLRRAFELTAEDLGRIRSIRARHDDELKVYLNGQLVFSEIGYLSAYDNIAVDDNALRSLKPGKNLMAAHCHQINGAQYVDVGLSENSPAPLEWHTDLKSARDRCERESRKLLVLYVANETTRGNEVEKAVFSPSFIRRIINERFVPLKLNMSVHPADSASLEAYRAGIIDLYDDKGGNRKRIVEPPSPAGMSAILKAY